MRRPDFPRYLKGSKLFIDIDIDYIVVVLISFIVSVFMAFMLNMPIYMAIILILLGVSVPVRAYQRVMKTAAPGFLKHFLHELGIGKKRGSNGSNRSNLPYGFERHFED